jgi:SAM-dependent methyltransferase
MTGGTAGAAPRPPARVPGRQLLRGHYDTLAALLDASTFRHLDRLGVAAGQRCWEAGAGGATVPAWLARRTGPAGYVLATDIDVTFLQEADGLPCEIARHDIGADPAPQGAFDLVHARLVLEHVPGRDAALRTMTRALRPGGWLLVESADPRLQPLACPDEVGPAQELANRLRNACWALQARRTDLGYGRTLPRRGQAPADYGGTGAGPPDRHGDGHDRRNRPAPGRHRRRPARSHGLPGRFRLGPKERRQPLTVWKRALSTAGSRSQLSTHRPPKAPAVADSHATGQVVAK